MPLCKFHKIIYIPGNSRRVYRAPSRDEETEHWSSTKNCTLLWWKCSQVSYRITYLTSDLVCNFWRECNLQSGIFHHEDKSLWQCMSILAKWNVRKVSLLMLCSKVILLTDRISHVAASLHIKITKKGIKQRDADSFG